MFGWLKRKPRTASEIGASQILEALEELKAEKGEIRDRFLVQVSILRMNFLGEYKSIEQFKVRSDDEKHRYFKSLREAAGPQQGKDPEIRLAYAYYSILIHLEEEGRRRLANKLRVAYTVIYHRSEFVKRSG